MKIRNRILTGILSLVLAAGELLPVCAAGTEQEINAGEEDQDRSGEPLQEETAAGEGEEEWFELDYTDKLVRMGGFPEAEDMAEADRIGDVDLGSAEEAIVDALRNFQPEIDVSAYGIPRQGAGDYYFRVLNRHPDLFYVEGRVSLSPVGDCVGRYRPTYSSEYNQSHVKKTSCAQATASRYQSCVRSVKLAACSGAGSSHRRHRIVTTMPRVNPASGLN